jgi:hypothetical protein
MLLRQSYAKLIEFFRNIVTKMAWCKARMKLAYSALIDLNSRLVNYFYAHFAANTSI